MASGDLSYAEALRLSRDLFNCCIRRRAWGKRRWAVRHYNGGLWVDKAAGHSPYLSTWRPSVEDANAHDWYTFFPSLTLHRR